MGTGSAANGEVADVPLLVSGDMDIQGFVMVFEWDASRGRGEDLVPADGAGMPLEGADLIVTRFDSRAEGDEFMVFSVVLDLDGAGGERIAAAQDVQVGTAKIRCLGPSEGEVETTIQVRNAQPRSTVDGGPELVNTLVLAPGRSITEAEGLVRRNGSFTCEGEAVPEGEVTFACGGEIDEEGKPGPVTGQRDSTVQVTFFYRAPGSGLGDQRDQIQGLSMGVRYNCNFTASQPADFDDGGVLESTMAEFIHFEIDNAARKGDGDPCGFTLGVLVDATAPFDGRTLPATSTFRKLFHLDFLIEDDAECGECLELNFRNDLTANDDRPVRNLVSINFQSQEVETCDCEVCIEGEPQFQRGDCNFSGGGRLAVDIADAAAQVGFFFLQGAQKFNAPCEDACDANDDGRLDAADVIFLLEFMFVSDKPRPPDPGPNNAGRDPTADDLGCDGGELSCD